VTYGDLPVVLPLPFLGPGEELLSLREIMIRISNLNVAVGDQSCALYVNRA
jgi:hypothetical protein